VWSAVPPVPIKYEGGWAIGLIWALKRRGKSVANAGNQTQLLDVQPIHSFATIMSVADSTRMLTVYP
jgi:hypothetical protein